MLPTSHSLMQKGQARALGPAPFAPTTKRSPSHTQRIPSARRANLLDSLFKKSKDDDSSSSKPSSITSSKKLEEDVPGFRFDPSMQRWIRDDRMKGKASADDMIVTPLSGSPYLVWPVMHTYLTEKGLKSVDIDQALQLMKKGAILVDVRLAKDYNRQHAQGAINVPLFRITAGDETMDKVKRFIMASLAMDSTERDPDFLKNMEKAVGGKNKKIIIMCATGGTLDTVVRVESTGKVNTNDPDRAFGRETRSLKACYELMKAGFKDVVHLQGGMSTWRYEGYPLE